MLARGFLASGDIMSALAFVTLVFIVGCFSALFLREYPSRLRLDGGEIMADFGLLAGTARFLRLARTDIVDVSRSGSWPFRAIKVVTKNRTYSWILSRRLAQEMGASLSNPIGR